MRRRERIVEGRNVSDLKFRRNVNGSRLRPRVNVNLIERGGLGGARRFLRPGTRTSTITAAFRRNAPSPLKYRV